MYSTTAPLSPASRAAAALSPPVSTEAQICMKLPMAAAVSSVSGAAARAGPARSNAAARSQAGRRRSERRQ